MTYKTEIIAEFWAFGELATLASGQLTCKLEKDQQNQSCRSCKSCNPFGVALPLAWGLLRGAPRAPLGKPTYLMASQ